MNYGLGRALADDETGFKGSDDFTYRGEGWDFILAGGAIYSSLDYSFTSRHPAGTLRDYKSPGGGSVDLRKQLRILKDFIEGLDFVRMAPNNAVIKGGLPDKATARALAQPGKAYAVYVRGGEQADLVLDLPPGKWQAEWVNTKTGAVDKADAFDHAGGDRTLASPPYQQDIALRLGRADTK